MAAQSNFEGQDSTPNNSLLRSTSFISNVALPGWVLQNYSECIIVKSHYNITLQLQSLFQNWQLILAKIYQFYSHKAGKCKDLNSVTS